MRLRVGSGAGSGAGAAETFVSRSGVDGPRVVHHGPVQGTSSSTGDGMD